MLAPRKPRCCGVSQRGFPIPRTNSGKTTMQDSTNTSTEKRSSIEELIADALTKESEQELNEEQLNLLRLCRLLVKIEYRHKYGDGAIGGTK